MPNVTGLHKKGRGRPTKEQTEAYKDSLKASPKLFDDTPYTISKTSSANIPNMPYGDTIDEWCDWVYEYVRVNPNCLSIVEIYENIEIDPPFTLTETLSQNNVNINTLLENRIINLTLQGKIKSVFAQSLLQQKYGWTEGDTSQVQFNDAEIKFNFG